jgi:ribonuclease HII
VRPSGDDHLVQVLEARARVRYGPVVAGVDEAGRGPLAGPLLVGAVILPPALGGAGALADSKALGAEERERLARWVRAHAVAWSLWRIGPRAIDAAGIGWAVRHGMVRALEGLGRPLDAALVDGLEAPTPGAVAGLAVVDGDRMSASIMAAAVLAKTARDREMARWHGIYPGYGFDRHKGYATPDHLARLRRLGPSPIHRLRFLGGQAPANNRPPA